MRDSAGRLIAFEHDRAGRLIAVKLPHPPTTAGRSTPATRTTTGATWPRDRSARRQLAFEYKQHLLVQETNRNGLSFYFAYDGHGEDACCVRTWGDGGIYDHVIDYDKVGKVTCVTNSLGHTTTYKMNVVGMRHQGDRSLGAARQYEYDERTLRKIKETTRLAARRRGSTTARKLRALTGADGATERMDFDARDQPIQAVDAVKGEWRGRTTRTGVCWDEPIRSSDACNSTGKEGGVGFLVALTDPAGQRTTFGYDGQRNFPAMHTPDGGETAGASTPRPCSAPRRARKDVERREYDCSDA